MRKVVLILAGIAATALAACDTTSAIAPYQASTSNVLGMQSMLRPSGKMVKVGEFTSSGIDAPMCRMAGKLDVTSGKPIEQYIKDALQTELFTAQVYDVNAPVTITGRLTQLKMASMGTGSWTLALHVQSNADPVGYDVSTTRSFKSSYSAMSACQNATNAFAPTVQDLLGQVVNNPGFAKLTGKA